MWTDDVESPSAAPRAGPQDRAGQGGTGQDRAGHTRSGNGGAPAIPNHHRERPAPKAERATSRIPHPTSQRTAQTFVGRVPCTAVAQGGPIGSLVPSATG